MAGLFSFIKNKAQRSAEKKSKGLKRQISAQQGSVRALNRMKTGQGKLPDSAKIIGGIARAGTRVRRKP